MKVKHMKQTANQQMRKAGFLNSVATCSKKRGNWSPPEMVIPACSIIFNSCRLRRQKQTWNNKQLPFAATVCLTSMFWNHIREHFGRTTLGILDVFSPFRHVRVTCGSFFKTSPKSFSIVCKYLCCIKRRNLMSWLPLICINEGLEVMIYHFGCIWFHQITTEHHWTIS